MVSAACLATAAFPSQCCAAHAAIPRLASPVKGGVRHLLTAPCGRVGPPSLAPPLATGHGSRARLAVGSCGGSPVIAAVRGIKTRKRLRQIFEKQKSTKGPKLKTVQGVRKRFRRTASGMLKYAHSGRVHNSQAKSKNKHRQLRKPGYVTGTMLKTLNRMLSKR